jgi:alpha-glucosidase
MVAARRVYQIYPRSFADASDHRVGDLREITERLPYLAWLGVDALWMSPIYASPMANLGYDITDHSAIGPLFGTLEDFDDLVARAHRLGLRVLLDFILNHSSIEHPWFVESRSSQRSPRRDW